MGDKHRKAATVVWLIGCMTLYGGEQWIQRELKATSNKSDDVEARIDAERTIVGLVGEQTGQNFAHMYLEHPAPRSSNSQFQNYVRRAKWIEHGRLPDGRYLVVLQAEILRTIQEFTIDVSNSSQEVAKIELRVLNSDYRWVYSKQDEVKFKDGVVDIRKTLLNCATMEDLFRRVDAIICVGMASSEGANVEEEARSRTRTTVLLNWIRQSSNESQPVSVANAFCLSLGRYKVKSRRSSSGEGDGVETSEQRKVVIIGITRKVGRSPSASALSDLIERELTREASQNADFPFNIANYSNFQFWSASEHPTESIEK